MSQIKPLFLLLICVIAAFGLTVMSMTSVIPPWVGAIICLPLGLISAPCQTSQIRGRAANSMSPVMGIVFMLISLVMLIALPIVTAQDRTFEGILNKNTLLPILVFIASQNFGVGFMIFRGI